jgi:hypothetical protein
VTLPARRATRSALRRAVYQKQGDCTKAERNCPRPLSLTLPGNLKIIRRRHEYHSLGCGSHRGYHGRGAGPRRPRCAAGGRPRGARRGNEARSSPGGPGATGRPVRRRPRPGPGRRAGSAGTNAATPTALGQVAPHDGCPRWSPSKQVERGVDRGAIGARTVGCW